jgi:hypothetical protein
MRRHNHDESMGGTKEESLGRRADVLTQTSWLSYKVKSGNGSSAK